MVYLRFMTDKWNIESAFIRLGTRSQFSHVEFLDTEAGTSLGALLKGGVQIRPMNYSSLEAWYTAPDIDASYKRAKEFIGCGYDWRDIAGIVVNKDWHREGAMICSQLAGYANRRAWAMDAAAPWISPDQPIEHCTPDILLWSPVLRCVKLLRR